MPNLMSIILFTFSSMLFASKKEFMLSFLSSILLLSGLLGESVESFGMMSSYPSSYLVSLSIIVVLMSLICEEYKKTKSTLILFVLVVVEIYFFTSSLIIFFVMFELSLIPLFILIIGWGKNPERLLAGKFMVMYTLLSSAPLLGAFLLLEKQGVTFVSFSQSSVEIFYPWVSVFCLLAFLVKTPMYLLHSWLPRAHVEAPLSGSMILAGIMLKVGIYGIMKMVILLPSGWESSIGVMISSISLVGSILSTILSLSSDDMKMSVAFSSISHMNLCVVGMMMMFTESVEGSVIIMITHGVISPLLFYVVSIPYEISHSRSVLVNKGILSLFPQYKGFVLLVWLMNMSIPPFLSFVGEVKLFFGTMILSPLSVVFVVSFLLFGSLFSILNFGLLVHSGKKNSMKLSPKLFPFLLLSSLVSMGLIMIFFLYSGSMSLVYLFSD